MDTRKDYKNRAMFKSDCATCHRPIYPSETVVTAYYTNEGKNINVLEAYNLPVSAFTFKEFCASH